MYKYQHKMILNFKILVFHFIVCFSNFLTCYSKGVGVTFVADSNFTGVVFSPYVRHFDEGIDAYSESDVKTMLQVIAERYNHIITRPGVIAPQEGPIQSVTYIPIAATKENRKNARSRIPMDITLTIDAGETDDVLRNMAYLLNLALTANRIYNRTVSTILIVVESIENVKTQETLIYAMDYARNHSLGQRLSIGVWMHLQECGTSTKLNTAPRYTRKVLEHADVVIFYKYPSDGQIAAGPQNGSQLMIEDFSSCEKRLRASFSSSKLRILWTTSWATDGGDEYTIVNSVTYWKLMSEWASQNKQFVFFLDAFDEPLQENSLANLGWWKLKRKDTRIITKSAFVEKVLDTSYVAEKNQLHRWSFSTIFGMGLFSGGFIVLIVAGTIFLLYKHFNKVQSQRLTRKDHEEFMNGCSGERAHNNVEPKCVAIKNMEMLRLPYDKERYELEKNSFTIDFSACLGTGAFGSVYRGRVNGMNNDVALKLTQPSCPISSLKGLLSEIKVLAHLGKHEHILSLIGAYTAELRSGIVYVIMELCEVGSLEKFLRLQQHTFSNDYASGTMTSKLNESGTRHYQPGEFRGKADMLRWSYEISAGMEYMTSKHVVHLDLATRNVLLTSSLQAKISDFGLSRRLYDYTNYVKRQQQEPLPWRWMSIEALKILEFSEKSDVWAFGCTMWEIYSLGDTPYPGLSWNLDFVQELQNGLRLQCPQYASHKLYNLMLECWHPNPLDRASFTKLKSALMGLYCRDKLQG